MGGGGGGDEGEFGLQIAPMLDVMFVLLLFFMVSAGGVVKEGELGIQVPGTGKAEKPGTPDTPITIKIDGDGNVTYNGTPVDSADATDLIELRGNLKNVIERFAQQPIIISPDEETRHIYIVRVLNACSWAGVQNVVFRKLPAAK